LIDDEDLGLRVENKKGLTLIEVLVVIALLGIVAAIALPNMKSFMQKQQANSVMHTLNSAIHYARSEAVKTGEIVGLCGSDDGETCSSDWSKGYIIYLVESNELLRSYLITHGHLQWRAFPTSQYLQFIPSGFSKQQNGTFVYCSADKSLAQALIVSQTGRVRIEKNYSTNKC
tara:strand:- start:11293 stop:11811 length:519 start_codon:yes stop_codon:yes gene_type:complete